MADLNHQLRLRARLAGKDASKLDPHVLDRFHGELERAATEQLRATGLLEEWLESWEARTDIASVPALVTTQENRGLSASRIDQEAAATVVRKPSRRSLLDKLATFEHAVQLFSEHLADFELRVKQARAPEHV
jgi:hypothetical protein